MDDHELGEMVIGTEMGLCRLVESAAPQMPSSNFYLACRGIEPWQLRGFISKPASQGNYARGRLPSPWHPAARSANECILHLSRSALFGHRDFRRQRDPTSPPCPRTQGVLRCDESSGRSGRMPNIDRSA